MPPSMASNYFLVFIGIGVLFLFKAETIEIIHTSGKPVSFSKKNYFAFSYTPELCEKIKYVLSLEDL